MKMVNLGKQLLGRWGYGVVLAGAVLWLDHFGWAGSGGSANARWAMWSVALVVITGLMSYFRDRSRRLVLAARLILGISFSLLILLATHAITAAVLAALYAALLWLFASTLNPNWHIALAGVVQFIGLWAIFLAGAVWNWPAGLLLVLTYITSFIAALWLVDPYEERARRLLATVWALIATECAYVFGIWTVNYIVKASWVVVPQAALVIGALGYVFASIYLAHKNSRLGHWRLAEYLLIGLLLIVIVAVGTKWSGAL